MMKRMLATVLMAAFVVTASGAPVLAQGKAGAEKRKPSPGVAAMHERRKKCGAEWRQAKAAGKTPAGQKWPQYWSACNKRLKAAGS